MNQATKVLIAALALVVVGGGAFYGGMKYGENRVLQDPTALFQEMRGQFGQRMQIQGQFPDGMPTPGAGDARRPVLGGSVGTVQEIEGNTLFINTEEGTVRVLTTDTTFIEKYASVDLADLDVGEQVIVSGSQNDDGSVTARSIRSMQGIGAFTSDRQ